MKIKIYICDELINHHNKIKPTIVNLFQIAGYLVEFVSNAENSDCVYSTNIINKKLNIISINQNSWDNINIDSNPIKVDGMLVPSICAIINNGINNFDWIACAYYFLNGLHEKKINKKINRVPGIEISIYNLDKFAIVNEISLLIKSRF